MLPATDFSYNLAVSNDLIMSPFELDLGSNPRSPLDFISGIKDFFGFLILNGIEIFRHLMECSEI